MAIALPSYEQSDGLTVSCIHLRSANPYLRELHLRLQRAAAYPYATGKTALQVLASSVAPHDRVNRTPQAGPEWRFPAPESCYPLQACRIPREGERIPGRENSFPGEESGNSGSV